MNKEIKDLTEEEAKGLLKQAYIKHSNCQIYLFFAVIFSAFMTAMATLEVYRKVEMERQVKSLEKENWDQSMEIRKLNWDIHDLKMDTAWFKAEIKVLNSESNFWKKLNEIR